jgi:hypothetical protein
LPRRTAGCRDSPDGRLMAGLRSARGIISCAACLYRRLTEAEPGSSHAPPERESWMLSTLTGACTAWSSWVSAHCPDSPSCRGQGDRSGARRIADPGTSYRWFGCGHSSSVMLGFSGGEEDAPSYSPSRKSGHHLNRSAGASPSQARCAGPFFPIASREYAGGPTVFGRWQEGENSNDF